MTPWDSFTSFCHKVGAKRVQADTWLRFQCPTPMCANKKDNAGFCRYDSGKDYWTAGCKRCQIHPKDIKAQMGLDSRDEHRMDEKYLEELEKRRKQKEVTEAKRKRTQQEVADIWVSHSVPVSADNDGGKYLISRGVKLEGLARNVCWLPETHDTWRSLPELSGYSGVLLWLLGDAPTSGGYRRGWQALQREAIAADGVRLDKAGKQPRHRKNWMSNRGKVFVSEKGKIGNRLGVAEGQIDALKVSQTLEIPCVASCSMSNMSALVIDPRLTLCIFPDPEEKALHHARVLSETHHRQGGTAHIIKTETDPGGWQ